MDIVCKYDFVHTIYVTFVTELDLNFARESIVR